MALIALRVRVRSSTCRGGCSVTDDGWIWLGYLLAGLSFEFGFGGVFVCFVGLVVILRFCFVIGGMLGWLVMVVFGLWGYCVLLCFVCLLWQGGLLVCFKVGLPV